MTTIVWIWTSILIVLLLVLVELVVRSIRSSKLKRLADLEAVLARQCSAIPLLTASEGLRLACGACGFHENLGKVVTTIDVDFAQDRHDTRIIR